MKATLVILLLCLAVVAIPAAAEAHTGYCYSDTTVATCMAKCTTAHLSSGLPHNCYIIVS